MLVPFCKYESIGNDFVLIESKSVKDIDLPELSKRMCDRKFGIGSDGLLVLETENEPYELRMFNPDGTEDFCGNGLRCSALHLFFLHKKKNYKIFHGDEEIETEISVGDWIDVTLPKPSFKPQDIPLRQNLDEVFETDLEIEENVFKICSVNTGSTHTVIFTDSPPDELTFQTISPKIENHEWFPKRTSVIWASKSDGKTFKIRIWERGVGETLGCGTGSAAVAACWFRKHPGMLALVVKNPGGDTLVAKSTGGRLIVSANAKRIYEGEFLFKTEQTHPPKEQAQV